MINENHAENHGMHFQHPAIIANVWYITFSILMFQFSFRVSIDEHPLHVIATDGIDVKEMKVDVLIIAPGERYDFWIFAKEGIEEGMSFWIRLETLGTSGVSTIGCYCK